MPRKPPPPDRTEELRASYRGGKNRPRELRITTLYRHNDHVTWIRIAGHWLAALGLTPGSRVIITAEPGKRTLTLAPTRAAVDAPPARNRVPARGPRTSANRIHASPEHIHVFREHIHAWREHIHAWREHIHAWREHVNLAWRTVNLLREHVNLIRRTVNAVREHVNPARGTVNVFGERVNLVPEGGEYVPRRVIPLGRITHAVENAAEAL